MISISQNWNSVSRLELFKILHETLKKVDYKIVNDIWVVVSESEFGKYLLLQLAPDLLIFYLRYLCPRVLKYIYTWIIFNETLLASSWIIEILVKLPESLFKYGISIIILEFFIIFSLGVKETIKFVSFPHSPLSEEICRSFI